MSCPEKGVCTVTNPDSGLGAVLEVFGDGLVDIPPHDLHAMYLTLRYRNGATDRGTLTAIAADCPRLAAWTLFALSGGNAHDLVRGYTTYLDAQQVLKAVRLLNNLPPEVNETVVGQLQEIIDKHCSPSDFGGTVFRAAMPDRMTGQTSAQNLAHARDTTGLRSVITSLLQIHEWDGGWNEEFVRVALDVEHSLLDGVENAVRHGVSLEQDTFIALAKARDFGVRKLLQYGDNYYKSAMDPLAVCSFVDYLCQKPINTDAELLMAQAAVERWIQPHNPANPACFAPHADKLRAWVKNSSAGNTAIQMLQRVAEQGGLTRKYLKRWVEKVPDCSSTWRALQHAALQQPDSRTAIIDICATHGRACAAAKPANEDAAFTPLHALRYIGAHAELAQVLEDSPFAAEWIAELYYK